jgi:hypothetical protein
VDLDTDAGYARYTLAQPRHIDFNVNEEAAHGAGYTLKEVTLELEGVTSQARCETCAATGPILTVPETGQTFELVGDVPDGERLRIVAMVRGWASGHAQLSLVSFRQLE